MATVSGDTQDQDTETDIRGISIVNVLLGVWLIITPYWFGYASSLARWDQTIIGIVVVIVAALRAALPHQRWFSWLAGIAGIWAIIAPFILSYNHAGAYWNSIIVGILVAAMAFYNASLPAVGHHAGHSHA